MICCSNKVHNHCIPCEKKCSCNCGCNTSCCNLPKINYTDAQPLYTDSFEYQCTLEEKTLGEQVLSLDDYETTINFTCASGVLSSIQNARIFPTGAPFIDNIAMGEEPDPCNCNDEYPYKYTFDLVIPVALLAQDCQGNYVNGSGFVTLSALPLELDESIDSFMSSSHLVPTIQSLSIYLKAVCGNCFTVILDGTLVIHQVKTVTVKTPYQVCEGRSGNASVGTAFQCKGCHCGCSCKCECKCPPPRPPRPQPRWIA